MNTKLTVRKIADTNYVKVKYSVVEMKIGADAVNTYVVIQTIKPGFDTLVNYDKWKSTWHGDISQLIGRDVEGMVGTIGEIEVVTLNLLIGYAQIMTPSMDQ